MPASDKPLYSQLKRDDIDRQLRSASPAIKRPASDMGAQDREEHLTDVEMGEAGDSGTSPGHAETNVPGEASTKAKQQDTGQRHRDGSSSNSVPRSSDPASMRQLAPSETSADSAADSTLPTPSNRSTTTTSTEADTSSSPSNLPSIDDQVAKVTQLVLKEIADGQKGYLVSAKWLHRIQARSSHPPEGQKVSKTATDGEIGPLDNTDIAMVTEDVGKLKDEAGEPFVPLRPGLVLGDDYQILPQDAWDLVMSWYGKVNESPVITRYAHDTTEGEGLPNVQYELNPPIFSFLKVVGSHTPQTQKDDKSAPVRMLASRKTPVMEWLRRAKTATHIDMNTKVRVWRVLGGLKNTSASGILTPAASRSASPAPGAELVANAGDRMVLDVNTFAALQTGEHRERLEINDQTADSKYNGRTTLGTIGLGRDDVIVLEEQKSGSADWPSETVKLSLTKGINRNKGLVVSGRSSPTPGMMTRGRQLQNGRPRGIIGLSNLGNTCYMNSALQCIRSVEELTQYFLHDEWKKELNPSNPLGHHGEVAKAYANLIKQIYNETSSSTNPSRFKSVVGKYGSSFSGYQQQDSQEFLLFLLDGLHEDLNRIQKKPYIEKPDSTDEMVHDPAALKRFADKNWEDYKARNDSVVTDLFAGMYKSTLTCPVCDKVSIIFDPFNNLTLQLPIENTWSKDILYFPLRQRPFCIDVDIDKNSTFRQVKEFIAARTKADPDKLFMAESYQNRFYKMFDNNTTISEASIQNADIICCYELESIPTNINPNKPKKFSIFTSSRDSDTEVVDAKSPAGDRLLTPVFHRLLKTNNSQKVSRPFFAQPTYIVLDRESNRTYDGVFRKVLDIIAGMTTKNIMDELEVSSRSNAASEDSDPVLMNDDASSTDSHQPQAASVDGEDEMVDISLPGNSPGAETSSTTDNSTSHRLGSQWHKLFNLTAFATGEGVPTGWNNIDEHKTYQLVSARVPKVVPHRPTKPHSSSGVTNGDDGSVTSEDELADIEHDEPTPNSNTSGSESLASTLLPDSDTEAGDERAMAKNRNRKTHKTRKPRRLIHKKTQRRSSPIRSAVSTEGLIRPGEAIILDWSQEGWDALFGGNETEDDGMRGAPTWKNVSMMPDEELAAKKAQRMLRKKNGISLEDCLNEYGKSEILSENNAWYCPRCKEHRRAAKMFELWKTPDILVMHLKRFSSNRNFRDKLEVKVDYPIEGLDLSTMVRDREDGKSMIYDLVAVDNHYGGLGGGHYTAYAKNFVDRNWHEYNDSHVSSRQDNRSVVTPAAYLLFYRRRSEHPLGGPKLEELLGEGAEGDSEMQTASREASPAAGEGQRLGGSSHFGSSSAFVGDRAHRVGDGGSDTIQQGRNRGLTPEDDDPPRQMARTTHYENVAPPAYESIELPGISGQGWSFENLGQPSSLDEDMFGDRQSSVDSNRAVGSSPSRPGSVIDQDELKSADDNMSFSDELQPDDFMVRNQRESAPPPYTIPFASHNDEEEELPVMELRGDDFDPVSRDKK